MRDGSHPVNVAVVLFETKTGGHLLPEGLKEEYEADRKRHGMNTRDRRRNSSNKRGRLSVLLTECAEMANDGSGIVQ